MLIGIDPRTPPPQTPNSPNLATSYLCITNNAHMSTCFPRHSPVATVDKRKQQSWRQQTKQINENAQTAPRFKMWKTARWKERLLIHADARRVIRGSNCTFCDLWPAGINCNDISKRRNIVLLTDVFGWLLMNAETRVFLHYSEWLTISQRVDSLSSGSHL